MAQDEAARAEVALGCQVLASAGLDDFVWGHISLRDPAGRGLWIKRAKIGFEEVGESDIQLVAWDGEVLQGEGPKHMECLIHTAVLQQDPAVNSVVHCHPPHAIALAATTHEFQSFSHTAGVFADGVPKLDGLTGLVDTTESAERLAAGVRGHRAAFLVGHGVITVGPSIAVATTCAVLLERACELQLLALGAGGVADPLSAARATEVYHHTQEQGHLQGAWEFLVRRVQRMP